MANFLGELIASTGKTLGLPELGFSEKFGATGSSPQLSQQFADYTANNLFGTGGTFAPAATSISAPQAQSFAEPATTASRAVAGGGGGTSYDPAAIAYYNDQEALARQAIDRLNAQRGIGQGNIQKSYQSALDALLGNNSQAERDAGLTKQRTIDDNVTARSTVDQTVARQAQGLRRLLGNSSSAAQYAAPLAVARQGNQQQGAIQTNFGRNLQNIDIADEDRRRAFEGAQGDLTNQRTIQENQLNAGILQNEATIQEQLQNIALQRAQAQGQNYAQARGSLTPFNDRISTLLSQIDQLGANPNIQARNVNFTAPSLENYNTSGIKVAQGQTPAQQAAGQYAGLLQTEDDRRKRLF